MTGRFHMADALEFGTLWLGGAVRIMLATATATNGMRASEALDIGFLWYTLGCIVLLELGRICYMHKQTSW